LQNTNTKPAAPILPLTSVRFLAAFYVVLHHSNLWIWGLDSSTFLGRFLRSGHVAVGFFFVLSGFILALVYLDTDRPFNRRKFWVARFARAYPLLLFSVIVAALPVFLRTWRHQSLLAALKITVPNIAFGALLLQAWATRFRFFNAPSRSLSAEAFFYLVFPFVAFWIWRRPGTRAYALLALFWFLSLLVSILLVHHDPSLFYQQSDSRARIQYFVQLAPVFRIFEFFAGITLCSLHRSLALTHTPAQRSRIAYPCFFLAVGLFLLVIAFAAHIPVMALNNGILLPAFLLLIFALANMQGWLALLFSHRCSSSLVKPATPFTSSTTPFTTISITSTTSIPPPFGSSLSRFSWPPASQASTS
jgi:peptidoglycan/LPS O-acetylase OafA/YrhL